MYLMAIVVQHQRPSNAWDEALLNSHGAAWMLLGSSSYSEKEVALILMPENVSGSKCFKRYSAQNSIESHCGKPSNELC